MFKHDWIVYATTDNQIKGVEGHKIEVINVTKKQAIDIMYKHLNHYSFRNIVNITTVKIIGEVIRNGTK